MLLSGACRYRVSVLTGTLFSAYVMRKYFSLPETHYFRAYRPKRPVSAPSQTQYLCGFQSRRRKMPLSLNCINVKGAMNALEHDILINISLASDQEAYRMRRESLEGQWLKKNEEIERLDDLISDKILRAGRINAFIEELQNAKAITEFSAQAWGVMVERVTVKRDGEIEYSFIDGSKVRV